MEDAQGFSPAVEMTRSNQVFAISGKNYVFDTLGPRSAFGNRFLQEIPLMGIEHCQGFQIDIGPITRSFLMTSQALMEWDEAKGGFQIRFITPDTTEAPYRWTYGYLNQVLYFCHPRVGIITTNVAGIIFQKAIGRGIPEAPIAIATDNGRLGVMTDQFLHWSAQSNGLDYQPEIGGAGAQKISDRVSGAPIMLSSYGQGFLTWTTEGVMKSDFVGEQFVYRHRSVSTEFKPINSFCVVRLNDQSTVILDQRGLFQTTGGPPTPMVPLFNEFLIDFIKRNRLTIGLNCRLEWDTIRRRLYVMVSRSQQSAIFERAFVLYPPLDKWGEFSEPCYGIVPVVIRGSLREDQYFGFVGLDGLIRLWLETGSTQARNSDKLGNLIIRRNQKPVQKIESSGAGRVVSASGVGNSSPVEIPQSQSGYYLAGSPVIKTPELAGLGAEIRLGLFRMLSDVTADTLSEMTELILRTGPTGEFGDVVPNYSLEAPTGVDFGEFDPAPNDGFERLNYVNHKVKVISTVDGVSEFQSAIPIITGHAPAARFFCLSSVGLWHMLEISAIDTGEAFHIRTVEMNEVPAGRLN
jgi:hypothetical protein